MGNGYHPPSDLELERLAYMASNDDSETWGDLKDLTSDWYRLKVCPENIRNAVTPFTRWVHRIQMYGIPWRARWTIFLTGRLPNDL